MKELTPDQSKRLEKAIEKELEKEYQKQKLKRVLKAKYRKVFEEKMKNNEEFQRFLRKHSLTLIRGGKK